MKSPTFMTQISILVVMAFNLVITGCATHSSQLLQQTQQQSKDQAVIEKVASALQDLDARIAKAQNNDVDTFSPDDMDEALGALSEARSYYERFQLEPQNVNKSISLFFGETMGEKSLSLISKANQALNRAEENKREADILFAEVNENFEWLKKFQAPTTYRYEYLDIQHAYKDMVQAVARGRIDVAKRRLPRLLKEQRALEVASAQRFYLDGISKRIAREGRYELDRYAAISYSNSLKALNHAKLVIAKDPRDEEAILAAKNQAEFSFDMAHAVAKDMKHLSDMDRDEMERWLLLLTAKLNEAGYWIGAKDMRNHPVLKQIDMISDFAKDKQVASQSEQAAEGEVAKLTGSETVPNESDDPVVSRMIQLEKTLSKQMNALTEQMNRIKAENKRALIQQDHTSHYVPLSERTSLFGY